MMVNEIMKCGNKFEVYNYDYMDLENKEQSDEQKERTNDERYFVELKKAIELEFETRNVRVLNKKRGTQMAKEHVLKYLKLNNFVVRISFIDSMLTMYRVPILELVLCSTFITAKECLVLSANTKTRELQSLDLSCNPISLLGLLYLINPRTSELRCL